MHHSKILIVGGGLAGLFCALKFAPHPVTILAAAPIGQGASSAWAQGGIAAALSEGDTPEKHTADTLAAGAGIVDERVTLGMARDASLRIHDLLEYGVPFDKDLEGHLVQSREAAHSERRIVRVKGDTAGKAIMEALAAAVHKAPQIEVIDGYSAESLLTHDGRVIGVTARGADGRSMRFSAEATILATGGVGFLYAVTTNPPQSRATGLAMAARAGAIIADAEFVQFHPTAIDLGRDPAPLATEALRGDGAVLINTAGERFMLALHKDAELAPRDIVARGVFAEIAAGRGAFLDARAAIGAEFPEKFPTVYAICKGAGIDPVTQPIPVAPAEHYHMGGVWTDTRGRTSLAGLWAIGEVACTGVHGANRLASNSLLEAIVFAARAAEDIAGAPPLGFNIESIAKVIRARAPDAPQKTDVALVTEMRQTMTRHVGVLRDGTGLASALATIKRIEREAKGEATRNLAVAALLIAATASLRHESRGGHFRSDFPGADPAMARRSRITLSEARTAASSI